MGLRLGSRLLQECPSIAGAGWNNAERAFGDVIEFFLVGVICVNHSVSPMNDGYGLKEPCREDDFFFLKEGFNVNDVDVSVTVDIAKRYASHVNCRLNIITVQDGGCVSIA